MEEGIQNSFIKILIEKGEIKKEKLEEIIREAKKYNFTPEEFVEERKIVSEIPIAKAKAEFFNLPFIDLRGLSIDKKLIKILPKELAENYKMVIFEQEENKIKVAFLNPADFKAQEAIKFITREKKLEPVFYVTTTSSLTSALDQYSGLSVEIEESLEVTKSKFKPIIEEGKGWAEVGLEEVTKVAPVAKLVFSILKYAVESRASDIHIEPLKDRTIIRYRIDGVLREKASLPTYLHSAIISRVKVMANLKLDETRIPQDGRIRLEVAGREIDLRISTLPLLDQEKVVMRILDPTQEILSLEELGFWGKGLEVIKNNIRKPHGMFLATGPTGCGKTTTLYALINILNKPGVNIITLEDPIEYFIAGINQSQIRPAIGYTFVSGLRSILRQDPNIIMVGEIRDNETAELAIHAALTGHIVLSTLHTNDAFGAVPRLIDMKTEPFLISSSLNVVIAQRLVRKICENCKVKIEVSPLLKKEILSIFEEATERIPEVRELLKKEIVVYRGKGCQKCNREGYKGRTSIFEILEITEKMREIILARCPPDKVKKEFEDQGMLSMYQEGWVKILKGLTTPEEVIKATKE